MTNSIDPNLFYSNNQGTKRKTGQDILGKDDFLKILMVQLQHQDPLNPMEDKDFIAQMATFSTLEQITNMSKSMADLVGMQQENLLVAFSQFVGKEVEWQKIEDDKGTEESDKPIITEGKDIVAGVRFVDGSVKFILQDGTELDPANISQVNTLSKENALIQASYLIGKSVTWKDEEDQEQKAVVKAVTEKDGITWLILDNDKKIKANQLTKIEN